MVARAPLSLLQVRGFLTKKARSLGKTEGRQQLLESTGSASQPAGTISMMMSPLSLGSFINHCQSLESFLHLSHFLFFLCNGSFSFLQFSNQKSFLRRMRLKRVNTRKMIHIKKQTQITMNKQLEKSSQKANLLTAKRK